MLGIPIAVAGEPPAPPGALRLSVIDTDPTGKGMTEVKPPRTSDFNLPTEFYSVVQTGESNSRTRETR